jgi:hypothetical protein
VALTRVQRREAATRHTMGHALLDQCGICGMQLYADMQQVLSWWMNLQDKQVNHIAVCERCKYRAYLALCVRATHTLSEGMNVYHHYYRMRPLSGQFPCVPSPLRRGLGTSIMPHHHLASHHQACTRLQNDQLSRRRGGAYCLAQNQPPPPPISM